MMENISMKSEHTSITFFIEGIDASKALTTNLIPSFFEITLSGLNALRALNAFSIYRD
jgi:hypothetical protein